MVALVVTNVVDIFLSYVLVRGVGPFPEMGWDGLAVGTTIGYFVGMAIILVRLLHRRTMLRLSARLMRPDSSLVRRLLRVSLPGGLDILSLIACQLWFVQIINALGNRRPRRRDRAAGGVDQLYAGSGVPDRGCDDGGTGAGGREQPAASCAVVVAIRTTVVLMCAIGVFLYVGADWLASFFVRDDQSGIAVEAAGLVRIVSFAQLPLAVLMVLTGSFAGGRHTGPTGNHVHRFPGCADSAGGDLGVVGDYAARIRGSVRTIQPGDPRRGTQWPSTCMCARDWPSLGSATECGNE